MRAAAAERKRREAEAKARAANREEIARDRARAQAKARARLLAVLVAESAHAGRLRTYVDLRTAPTLLALGVLAMHYFTGSVRFEGVRFPVRRSVHGGAVLHPDTREELVLFLC